MSMSDIRERMAVPGFGSYATAIARNYWGVLSGSQPIDNLPFAFPIWLGVMALLAVNAIALRWESPDRPAIALMHSMLLLGVGLYAAALLFFYLFAFPPYEAIRLASMTRDLGTYVILWLLAGFAILLWTAPTRATRLSTQAWCILILLAAGPGFWTAAKAGPRGDAFSRSMIAERQAIRHAFDPYLGQLPQDARVYIVWNGTTGLPYYISQFELKPRRTSVPHYLLLSAAQRFTDPLLWCYSLGPPRFQNDIWSCDWTLDAFVAALDGYDYLFVGNADQVFAERYGIVFPEGSLAAGQQLFRLRHDMQTLRIEAIAPGPQKRS
jgi:hypothetical protein